MGFQGERIAASAFQDRYGVGFGSSGVRAEVSKLTDLVVYGYTQAFLRNLMSNPETRLEPGQAVAIGGDLRPSTDRIAAAVSQAIIDLGFVPVNLGKTSSPAVALYGLKHKIPTVMVTGSHIPDDRNGFKFTTAKGEITKADEADIKAQTVVIPKGVFGPDGMFLNPPAALPVITEATQDYLQRYLSVFPENFLAGKRIGVYQHSAVGRDILSSLYTQLGATVIQLGRSDKFIPVDTEAIREEDYKLARAWAKQHKLDAVVSADGDSDRPLISDEKGRLLRGDVTGILTALFLKINAISTPVSCNTALEKCGSFDETLRGKIGSPYVIEGMENLAARHQYVAGYEANGGFLLFSDVPLFGKVLPALPTRDCALVHLAVLGLSIERNQPISEVVASLPPRFTESGRLAKFPKAHSKGILQQFEQDMAAGNFSRYEAAFGSHFGKVASVDLTDGIRVTHKNGDISHLRGSNNADDFRIYTEAKNPRRAKKMVEIGLKVMEEWRPKKTS